MVLNNYRERADVILVPIAGRLTRISPNTITYISLLFAAVCGISFYLSDQSDDYLILAFTMMFLSALFDALDGKVARITNTVSIKGDLLDHVIDRYSDILILGGIAFSPYCSLEIGFIAIITVLMLSYMGTQAQAVGGKRHYGGWLGRADRLMLLLGGTMLQYIMITMFDTREIFEFYLLSWLLLLFIFVGNIDAIRRFQDTWRDLDETESADSEDALPERSTAPVRPRIIESSEDSDDIEWSGK